MQSHCSICLHPQRAVIDALLVAQNVKRAVARQFGTSHMSLIRHERAGHIPDYVIALHETSVKLKALNALQEATSILEDIIDTEADHEITIKALAERRQQIKLEAEINGLLRPINPDADFDPQAAMVERKKAFIAGQIDEIQVTKGCSRLEAAYDLRLQMARTKEAHSFIDAEIKAEGGEVPVEITVENITKALISASKPVENKSSGSNEPIKATNQPFIKRPGDEEWI